MLLHMVADKVAGMVTDMGAGGRQGGWHGDRHGGRQKKVLGGHIVAHGCRQGGWHGGRHGTCPFYIFCRNQFSAVFDNQWGSMEYIEEVQKQLEVVVVVKEEKIKAGRRCSRH